MNSYKVKYIYLVPTDGTQRGTDVIRQCALHHQAWYQDQMGDFKTFALWDGVVDVILSTHNADWFSTNPDGDFGLRYWNNTRADVSAMRGPRLVTEDRIIFCDALKLPGQAVGGAIGQAVLHQQDVTDLLAGSCLRVGGIAHEVGHTLGLRHPTPDDPDWEYARYHALMGSGYAAYPNCVLLQRDKDTLEQNRFLDVEPFKRQPGGMCPFDFFPRPAPVPAPRP